MFNVIEMSVYLNKVLNKLKLLFFFVLNDLSSKNSTLKAFKHENTLLINWHYRKTMLLRIRATAVSMQ